jgi:hypothetical protein
MSCCGGHHYYWHWHCRDWADLDPPHVRRSVARTREERTRLLEEERDAMEERLRRLERGLEELRRASTSR